MGALLATANLLKTERSSNNEVLLHEPVETPIMSKQVAAVISKASTLRLFQETTTSVETSMRDTRRVGYEDALDKFKRLLKIEGSIDRKTLKFVVPEWFDGSTGAFHYVVFAHDVALTLAVVLNSSSVPIRPA